MAMRDGMLQLAAMPFRKATGLATRGGVKPSINLRQEGIDRRFIGEGGSGLGSHLERPSTVWI